MYLLPEVFLIRSFKTEQTHLTLYMTAIASLSTLVGKPIIKVFPENGLNVKIAGSSVTENHPTTLSPSTLVLDWNCNNFWCLAFLIVTSIFCFYKLYNFCFFFRKFQRWEISSNSIWSQCHHPSGWLWSCSVFPHKTLRWAYYTLSLIIHAAFPVSWNFPLLALSLSDTYNLCFLHYFRIQPRWWRRISERMGYIRSFFLRVRKYLSQNHNCFVTGELAQLIVFWCVASDQIPRCIYTFLLWRIYLQNKSRTRGNLQSLYSILDSLILLSRYIYTQNHWYVRMGAAWDWCIAGNVTSVRLTRNCKHYKKTEKYSFRRNQGEISLLVFSI